MAIHLSILAWKIPWTEEPGGYSPWSRKESDTTEQLSLTHSLTHLLTHTPAINIPTRATHSLQSVNLHQLITITTIIQST